MSDEFDAEALLETEVAGLPPGFQLPERYRPQKSLGHGGMGVVFRTWDSTLERLVAVKIIRPDKLSNRRIKKRFEREVTSLAGINHPNVVRVFDYDRAGDVDFYVMEYIEGMTFGALMRRNEVDIKRAVSVTCQVTDGLIAVHEAGLLHRDIKPENILIAKDGTAKLMDFGLVGVIDLDNITRVTQTGHAVGTSGYMPPEMFLKGKADKRSDIFQIGVCLYEGLTGELPLTPKMLGALIAGGGDPAPPPPSKHTKVPDDCLDEICLKAVAFRPAERYQAATILREDLRKWLLEYDRTRPRPLPKKGKKRQEEKRAAAEATVALEKDELDVLDSAEEMTRPIRAKRIGMIFVLLLVAIFAALLWIVAPPGGSQLYKIIKLDVAGRGCNSALITWTANWKEVNPSLFLELAEGKQISVTVKAVTVSEINNEREKSTFEHRAIITGLAPGKNHKIRFRKPDGTYTLGRSFKTLSQVEFLPTNRVTLTADGYLKMTFSAAKPFFFRLTHKPLRYEPAPCRKETSSRKSTSVTYDMKSLAKLTNIGVTYTSIDGTALTTSIFPRKALAQRFNSIYEDYLRDHRSGNFLRRFQGGTRRRNEMFFSAARRRNAMRHSSAQEKAALIKRFWLDVEKRLRSDSPWYESLENQLPGIPSLMTSGIVDDEIRQSIELSLLPIELINGAALWYRLPGNESWAKYLKAPLHPNPVSSGKSTLSKVSVITSCTPILLPDLPIWNIFDVHDKEATKLIDPGMMKFVGLQDYTAEVASVNMQKAELEVMVRSANIGAAIMVEVNDKRAFLTFPTQLKDFNEYDKNLEENRSYTKFGGMALMNTFGSVSHYRSSIADLDTALPQKVYSLHHPLPVKALKIGKNRFRLTVFTGPVDIPRPTIVVGLRLRQGL